MDLFKTPIIIIKVKGLINNQLILINNNWDKLLKCQK